MQQQPKKLEEYEWICSEPFTSITTRTTGTYEPCCVLTLDLTGNDARDRSLMRQLGVEVDESTDLSIAIDSILPSISDTTFDKTPFITSTPALILKKAFIDNDREILDVVCRTCVQQEKAGVKSHRINYLDEFKEPEAKETLERAIHNYTEPPEQYHSVDLTGLIGNVCNLACNMCHEVSSSKYASEVIRLKEIPLERAVVRQDPSESFLKHLQYELLPKTNTIKVTGGEPLMSKQFMSMISDIHPDIKKKLSLKISTNLTRDPGDFVTQVAPFKDVNMLISVEGVGKVQEYIRYPSKWQTIVDNIPILKKEYNISSISFATTVNALNIAYNYQVCQAAEQLDVGTTFGSLVTSNFYTIDSIPLDIRDQYLNKMYQYGRQYNEVRDLIKLLEQSNYNENQMWGMLKHIKRRDILRKRNLLDVFPEWEPYYNQL